MTRRPLLAALWACLLLSALPGSAAAHASLVESDPPEGGTIQTPYTLTAQFDEQLDPERSRIVVENAAGDEVARGGVTSDDDTVMTVDLPPLPPGEYEAFWTARTPDDEGVTRDTIAFTVAPAATPTPVATPARTVAATPAATLAATAPPTASPTAAPAASPSPSPSPTPSEPGTGDLLLALVVAAGVVAALVAYLLRRGRA